MSRKLYAKGMIGRILNRAHGPMLRRALLAAGRATATQRVGLVAAGCAFYATLALFPTITMLISLYGLVYNPDTVQPQLHYLRGFMPPEAYVLISGRIQSLVAQPARGLGINFVLSLLLSLWSSSTGMKSIINALTLAYEEHEARGIIRFQMISLGMTLVAVVGTALAIGVLVFIPVAVRLLRLPGDA
ncbi:MAG TPA: YihY/virulence factor BrkB family protein, partial [Acidocella sp.]|nr:YihY/virulence factor BrkB family protein [Acidocella sp.]